MVCPPDGGLRKRFGTPLSTFPPLSLTWWGGWGGWVRMSSIFRVAKRARSRRSAVCFPSGRPPSMSQAGGSEPSRRNSPTSWPFACRRPRYIANITHHHTHTFHPIARSHPMIWIAGLFRAMPMASGSFRNGTWWKKRLQPFRPIKFPHHPRLCTQVCRSTKSKTCCDAACTRLAVRGRGIRGRSECSMNTRSYWWP